MRRSTTKWWCFFISSHDGQMNQPLLIVSLNTTEHHHLHLPYRARKENMDIIDALTGEIIEKDDPNDIATRKLYEVGAIGEQTFDFLRRFKDMEEQYDTFRYVLKQSMEENGIKKWDNELFSCSVTPEGTSQRFDGDRAKSTTLKDFLIILSKLSEEDLNRLSVYDFFQKLSYNKSKLNIRFKEKKYDQR